MRTAMMQAAQEPARQAPASVRATPGPAQIQRCGGVQCPPGTCDHDGEDKIQRSAEGGPSPVTVPGSISGVLRQPGQPLDAATRTGMESRFGHDFGQVRVHTDGPAARSAAEIHAQAYTFGRHVVMGQGRYQPQSADGLRLLTHEMTHVVQQGSPTADLPPAHALSHEHDPAEREAETLSRGAGTELT